MTTLLLINPNTTASITDLVLKTAKRFAAKGTTLRAVTGAFGPRYIASRRLAQRDVSRADRSTIPPSTTAPILATFAWRKLTNCMGVTMSNEDEVVIRTAGFRPAS